MDCYIYCADIYCQACADDIKSRLAREGNLPADPDDETSYDSDEYPKGPFSDEESDSPQHCGSGPDCLSPHIFPSGYRAGAFLENPLTVDGESEVRRMHSEGRSEVTEFWMDYYELRRHCEWCDGELEETESKLCDGCNQGN